MIRYRLVLLCLLPTANCDSSDLCLKTMGISQSYPGLTEDVIEDYTTLTYLNKGEVL